VDWTRNFSSTIYGTYTEVSYNSTVVNNRLFCGGGGAVAQAIVVAAATTCDPGFKFWTIGTHHDWFPLPGLRFAVDVQYTGIGTAMDGQTVTLTTKQGNRPSGVYTAKDLSNLAVMFRAIRAWGG
jgi:Porin subfamily